MVNPGTGQSKQEILKTCQEIEYLCAELYHFFAEYFVEDFEAVLLWRKTALEEENHAKQYDLTLNFRNQKVEYTVAIEAISTEITCIYLRSLINKVKEHPHTLEEALRMAIHLEEKLLRFHHETTVQFEDPSFRKLFQALANSDRHHVEDLKNALRNRFPDHGLN